MEELKELEQTILDGLNAFRLNPGVELAIGTETEHKRLEQAANARLNGKVALRRLIELAKEKELSR